MESFQTAIAVTVMITWLTLEWDRLNFSFKRHSFSDFSAGLKLYEIFLKILFAAIWFDTLLHMFLKVHF